MAVWAAIVGVLRICFSRWGGFRVTITPGIIRWLRGECGYGCVTGFMVHGWSPVMCRVVYVFVADAAGVYWAPYLLLQRCGVAISKQRCCHHIGRMSRAELAAARCSPCLSLSIICAGSNSADGCWAWRMPSCLLRRQASVNIGVIRSC